MIASLTATATGWSSGNLNPAPVPSGVADSPDTLHLSPRGRGFAAEGFTPVQLPVAILGLPGKRHSLHRAGRAMRHGSAVPLDELAAAAGFRVEARDELPMLRYIRAVRPDGA